MSRPPWGHISRHCVVCGGVGPRCRHPILLGWCHKRCLCQEELRVYNRMLRCARKREPDFLTKMSREPAASRITVRKVLPVMKVCVKRPNLWSPSIFGPRRGTVKP